jgi:hypothetical protein
MPRLAVLVVMAVETELQQQIGKKAKRASTKSYMLQQATVSSRVVFCYEYF